MKAGSHREAEGHQGAREGRDGREARFGHIMAGPGGLAFPTASEQAQGARNPAVHVQARRLLQRSQGGRSV